MILCDDFFSFRYIRRCKYLNIIRSGPCLLQRRVRNIIIASAYVDIVPHLINIIGCVGCVAKFTSVKGYNGGSYSRFCGFLLGCFRQFFS